MLVRSENLSEHFIQQSKFDNAGDRQCAKGVANILESVGVSVTRGDAYTWKDTLPQNGWVKLEGIRPENAPSGAVIVYDRDPPGQRFGKGGSTYGHVELVAEDKSGNRHYVSDKARSNSGGTVPGNFVGVYVNPKLTPLDGNLMLASASNVPSNGSVAQKKSSQDPTTKEGTKDIIIPNQSFAAVSNTGDNSSVFNSEANQSSIMIFAAIISALFNIDMGLDKSPRSETQLAAGDVSRDIVNRRDTTFSA